MLNIWVNILRHCYPFDSNEACIKMQRGCMIDKISCLIAMYIFEKVVKVFNAQAISYKLSLVIRVNKAILIREINSLR
jgi:hypothetical protein